MHLSELDIVEMHLQALVQTMVSSVDTQRLWDDCSGSKMFSFIHNLNFLFEVFLKQSFLVKKSVVVHVAALVISKHF